MEWGWKCNAVSSLHAMSGRFLNFELSTVVSCIYFHRKLRFIWSFDKKFNQINQVLHCLQTNRNSTPKQLYGNLMESNIWLGTILPVDLQKRPYSMRVSQTRIYPGTTHFHFTINFKPMGTISSAINVNTDTSL